jgi:adenine phosphoribosyltransferase
VNLAVDMNLKEKIAEYPNFPKKGILFRDFSPVLKDPSSLSQIADEFSKHFHPKNVDLFVGIESRGFLLATILALRYNKGIVMVRKAGKLPGKTAKLAYTIEYGKDTIEIQKDILEKGQRVIICDDLLATGGTAKAAGKLIEKVGGEITGFAFIIELTELNGIKGLSKYNCKSLVKY